MALLPRLMVHHPTPGLVLTHRRTLMGPAMEGMDMGRRMVHLMAG